MRPKFRFSPAMFLVCALFVLMGVLRLNDLSMYNPDSTRYLIWGNSLAHGKGFVDATQPEPDRYVIHAPLYALLIAPVELVIPNSLTAVKIESIAWGIAALLLFYFWMRGLLGTIPAIAGSIMLACNPLMLLYSTEALSEVPFLTMTLALFLLCDRDAEEEPRAGRSFALLLVCVSLLPLLREVGVALAAACALRFALRREPRKAALVLIAPALLYGLWYVRNHILAVPSAGSQSGNFSLLFQHFATPENESILSELAQRVWLQGKEYFFQLAGMLIYPQFGTNQISLIAEPSGVFTFFMEIFKVLKFLVAGIALPLMAAGLYADFRKSVNAALRCAAGALYLLSILLYPIHDMRFLFPLLPLMIFYGLSGAKYLYREKLRKNPDTIARFGPARIGIVYALLLVPNLAGIRDLLATNLEYQKSPILFHQKLSALRDYPPIFAQPWSLLASWIRQRTPENIIIASSAKDIAPMVGARKILELDPGVPQPEFERILRDNAVGYIISPLRWDNMTAFEFLTRESNRLSFEAVYSVANLRLLKVHSRFLEPEREDTTGRVQGDSLSAGGLLKRGRMFLIRGDYPDAADNFTRAQRLAPYQPDILYQLATVHAFTGDTAGAINAFRTLLTLPQAGSFLYATQRQLEALDLLSGSSRTEEEREIRAQDAASVYWNLGYSHRAFELSDRELKNNSHYFKGLLWGFHYAFQQGDAGSSGLYFNRLVTIDSSNAVVEVFRNLLAIRDSLTHVTIPHGRSMLHLSNAGLYRTIELYEEAIDEAERSLGEDGNNAGAISFLEKSFELKRSPRAMKHWLEVEFNLDSTRSAVSARIDSLRKVLGEDLKN